MNLYRLRAMRKRRRVTADADAAAADERFQQCVGDLLGLGEDAVSFLPPSVQVGWMETGQLRGGLVYCVHCAPQQPTSNHTPVYKEGCFATRPCVVCGRRLEHTVD